MDAAAADNDSINIIIMRRRRIIRSVDIIIFTLLFIHCHNTILVFKL
jgi:hypothetical protein